MQITQEKIYEYFKDESHHFMIWNEDDTFTLNNAYSSVEYLSLFVSLSGSIGFETNMQTQHADGHHLQFFVRDLSVKITDVSEDYRSIGIIFSKKYWVQALIHAHPYITMAAVQSCLAINDTQRSILIDFINFLRYARQSGKTDDNPVIQHILMGMFCEIGKMYETWARGFSKKSGSKVLAEFTNLIYQNYRTHRDVGFYAKALNLSNSHFSDLVKKATGLTAFKCIEKYVILKACAELSNTCKTVKEIAEEMHFDGSSHFCKYFRKNMNMSPEEYRELSATNGFIGESAGGSKRKIQ